MNNEHVLLKQGTSVFYQNGRICDTTGEVLRRPYAQIAHDVLDYLLTLSGGADPRAVAEGPGLRDVGDSRHLLVVDGDNEIIMDKYISFYEWPTFCVLEYLILSTSCDIENYVSVQEAQQQAVRILEQAQPTTILDTLGIPFPPGFSKWKTRRIAAVQQLDTLLCPSVNAWVFLDESGELHIATE